MKVLVASQKGGTLELELSEAYSKEDLPLQELADHLRIFRKAPIEKTVSPVEDLRKALLADFPYLAKL